MATARQEQLPFWKRLFAGKPSEIEEASPYKETLRYPSGLHLEDIQAERNPAEVIEDILKFTILVQKGELNSPDGETLDLRHVTAFPVRQGMWTSIYFTGPNLAQELTGIENPPADLLNEPFLRGLSLYKQALGNQETYFQYHGRSVEINHSEINNLWQLQDFDFTVKPDEQIVSAAIGNIPAKVDRSFIFEIAKK